MAHFDSAIAIRPKTAAYHLHRGEALWALDKRDDAIASYRIKVNKNIVSAVFLSNKAKSFIRLPPFHSTS